MTEITILTNQKEADEILAGDKRWVVREQRVKEGTIFRFQLIKNNRRALHKVNAKKYTVTRSDDYLTAPIVKGVYMTSFKEVEA